MSIFFFVSSYPCLVLRSEYPHLDPVPCLRSSFSISSSGSRSMSSFFVQNIFLWISFYVSVLRSEYLPLDLVLGLRPSFMISSSGLLFPLLLLFFRVWLVSCVVCPPVQVDVMRISIRVFNVVPLLQVC